MMKVSLKDIWPLLAIGFLLLLYLWIRHGMVI